MISIDELILLDTNIILQFIRKNIVGQQIETDYQFRSSPKIAATAATLGVWLMTTDDDFDHLHPKYIQRNTFLDAERQVITDVRHLRN